MARNSSANRALSERGETQLGVVLAAVVLGVGCWAVFSLEACIRDHKDSKVQKRHDQYMSQFKPRTVRKLSGYSVKAE